MATLRASKDLKFATFQVSKSRSKFLSLPESHDTLEIHQYSSHEDVARVSDPTDLVRSEGEWSKIPMKSALVTKNVTVSANFELLPPED